MASSAGASSTREVVAPETMEVLYEISQLLNTGLDRQTLSILTALCESGVNPEALAHLVKELTREARALAATQPGSVGTVSEGGFVHR